MRVAFASAAPPRCSGQTIWPNLHGAGRVRAQAKKLPPMESLGPNRILSTGKFTRHRRGATASPRAMQQGRCSECARSVRVFHRRLRHPKPEKDFLSTSSDLRYEVNLVPLHDGAQVRQESRRISPTSAQIWANSEQIWSIPDRDGPTSPELCTKWADGGLEFRRTPNDTGQFPSNASRFRSNAGRSLPDVSRIRD